jgi:C4-dicarboxylate transporter DctM subunit
VIEAVLGFLGVFALAFLRVPLAVAMSIAGIVGLGLMRGWQPAFASTSQVVFETGFHYTLSVIPLFVLMGNFVARAGMARELFNAANAFVGHRPGGLAMASLPRAALVRSVARRSPPPQPCRAWPIRK